MENEFDLRPYGMALIRRWRIIALITLGLMAIGVVFAVIAPQTYTTRVDVLLLPIRSQLEFDSRFVTQESISSPTAAISQKQALIALASSSTLEEQVLPILPQEMIGDQYQPGSLSQQISIETQGDLLIIKAEAADQQQAYTLAEAWSNAYIQSVNNLYRTDQVRLEEVEQQLVEAQQRYTAIQQEYEDFLGQSQLVQLNQQITVVQDLLDGSNESNQALYTQYLSRTHELELIVNDAQTMQDQVQSGQTSDLADSLATLVLRARIVGDVQLPIDLQFNDPAALTGSDAVSRAEITSFIGVVEERRGELLDEARQLAQNMAAGEADSASLTLAQRQQYEETLTNLQQELEKQMAQQNMLRQQRDLAVELLSILQSKLDEQRVDQGTSQGEVRMVGITIEPGPSTLSQVVLYGAAGLIFGVVAGIMVAVMLELVAPRLFPRQSQSQGSPPVDRPIAS